MVKRTILYLLFALLTFNFAAKAIENETKTINLPNISDVKISVGIKLVYNQSNDMTARIIAPKKKLDDIKVTISHNKLSISYNSNKINNKNGEITVYLCAPEITSFEAATGSNIEIKTLDLNKKIKLRATTGSSIFSTKIISNYIDMSALTGSSITIKDLTVKDSLYAIAQTGSRINIDDLTSKTMKTISQTGSVITMKGEVNDVDLTSSSGSKISASKLIASKGSLSATAGSSISSNIAQIISLGKDKSSSIKNK